jgi:hypothetical protein
MTHRYISLCASDAALTSRQMPTTRRTVGNPLPWRERVRVRGLFLSSL